MKRQFDNDNSTAEDSHEYQCTWCHKPHCMSFKIPDAEYYKHDFCTPECSLGFLVWGTFGEYVAMGTTPSSKRKELIQLVQQMAGRTVYPAPPHQVAITEERRAWLLQCWQPLTDQEMARARQDYQADDPQAIKTHKY